MVLASGNFFIGETWDSGGLRRMNTDMKKASVWGMVLGLALGALHLMAQEAPAFRGPVDLRVDDLKTPLGIDDPAPRFGW